MREGSLQRIRTATHIGKGEHHVEVYRGRRARLDGGKSIDDCGDKLFRGLMSHVTRASELRAQVVQISAHATIGLAVLDALPHGIVVVDAACCIQYNNRPGEACIGSRGLFTVHDGCAVPHSANHQASFRTLVTRACTHAGVTTVGTLRLFSDGRTFNLSVLPLRPQNPFGDMRQMPMAMVVITDSQGALNSDPLVLRDLLCITPAEARLALQLAAGKTVKAYAAAEGCTLQTARTHLRNLMHKCECHRQVELVQLVQSLQLG